MIDLTKFVFALTALFPIWLTKPHQHGNTMALQARDEAELDTMNGIVGSEPDSEKLQNSILEFLKTKVQPIPTLFQGLGGGDPPI